MRSVLAILCLASGTAACSADAERPGVSPVVVGGDVAVRRPVERAAPATPVPAGSSAPVEAAKPVDDKPSAVAALGADHPGAAGSSRSGDSGRRKPPPPRERTQFVLLSFDTTPSWKSRGPCSGFCSVHKALNRDRDPDRPPNSFTLFISTGGMQFSPDRRRLSDEERRYLGVEPRLAPVYQYADSLKRVLAKAERIRQLDELGIELASHSVRHLHGGAWSEEQWRFELADHQRILDLVGLPHPVGFRAPFLEGSPGLYAALEAFGAVYDSSEVAGRTWPRRHPGTRIWVFGLPTAAVPGRGRVLFFDDNLRSILKSAAADAGVTGEERVGEWVESRFFAVALREFQVRYGGDRAPFLITGHGNFLDPMLRLMRRVCPLPGVRCATFREAAAYMDEHPELEGVGEEDDDSDSR